jgi:hypothetical protein
MTDTARAPDTALWLTQPIPAVVEPAPAPPKPGGMHLVVALGVVLIGYSYLAALWPVRHGFTPDAVQLAREWLNFPLGIGDDFGLLGAGLLLVAGGFWAAGQLADDPRRLAWLALVRGYLPYALACTISWLLLLGQAEPLTAPRHVDPTAGGYPANLLLVDRVLGEGALLGLGWGVAVAGCSAVLLAGTAALLTRGRWLALLGLAVQLAVVAAVSVTAAGTGGWYHELGRLLALVVFPLLGQLVWVARAHSGTGWAAAPIGVGCLAVLVAAERGYSELGGSWLALTLVYAVLVVLLVARANPVGGRVVRWLGSRGYPTALLVCAIGYPLLGALDRVDVRFWLALPLGVLATLLIAEIVHRLTGVLAR